MIPRHFSDFTAFETASPRFHSNRRSYDRGKMRWVPVIKGTRIPVDAIVRKLTEEMSIKEMLEAYSNLTEEDIKAALEYAAKVVSGEEVMPLVEKAEEEGRILITDDKDFGEAGEDFKVFRCRGKICSCER